jgi:hypothetical protein
MTWRADHAKEAYYDGKQAFRDGVEANPHIMGCYEFDAWNRGYEAAQETEAQIRTNRAIEGAS